MVVTNINGYGPSEDNQAHFVKNKNPMCSIYLRNSSWIDLFRPKDERLTVLLSKRNYKVQLQKLDKVPEVQTHRRKWLQTVVPVTNQKNRIAQRKI